MDRAKEPRLEILQIIERVRDGEEAKDVVTGCSEGKGEEEGSEGLRERAERNIDGVRRKQK